MEKSNLLLSDANERLDVREEELVNLEERLMKANAQFGNLNTELREAKRQIRNFETRIKEQNNASMVSNMCEDLQKQLLQAETLLEKRKEEIESLTEELSHSKSRTAADNELQKELEKLNDRLTKTLVNLSNAQKESSSLKVLNARVYFGFFFFYLFFFFWFNRNRMKILKLAERVCSTKFAI